MGRLASRRGKWAWLVCFALACDDGRDPDDGAPPPEGKVTLTVASHQFLAMLGPRQLAAGRTFQVVSLKLVNGRSEAIASGYDHFRLQTGTSGGAHRAVGESAIVSRACPSEAPARGSIECNVAFETAAGQQPTKVLYDSGDGITAEAVLAVAPVCTAQGPEDTFTACSDGCDNEGDQYTDCGDSSCCTARTNCPADTYCGANTTQCVNGEEDSYLRCVDACDNDLDTSMDCADPGCCAFVSCPSGTYCGAQSDPFLGPLVFDDAALASLNPSVLGGGATPCRSPVLVEVSYVSDGDTFGAFVPSTGITEDVRIIGVDTPEIAHPGMAAECYGPEAKIFTQQFDGHRLWLTFDSVCLDMFGRTLAYVYYGGDGAQMLQRQLLRRGFGNAYPFRNTATFEAQFAADEADALARRAGLHAACP